MEEKKKEKKKLKAFDIIILVISISLVVVALFFLINYYLDYKKDESIVSDLRELIIDEDKDSKSKSKSNSNKHKDYSELYNANHDFVGWLKIDGTIIDYPVMQHKTDETYYLKRNFYKEYSGAGSLFCSKKSDVKTPSSNIVIHGHNMNSGAMFHSLTDYENKDYYLQHKYITFDTIYRYCKYEVIAAFRTDVNPGSYEYYDFTEGTEEDFNKYVSFATSRTPYTMDSTAIYGDKLITLSTCAYHTKNGRFVVVAKQIESEDVNNINIIKNSN